MDKQKNICLAIIGGDQREIVLVKALVENGYQIKVFGLPASLMPAQVEVCTDFRKAVQGAHAVILPMPGINNKEILYAKFFNVDILLRAEDFMHIAQNVPVFVGAASVYLKQLSQKLNFPLIEVADIDEIAIPNSVPSAEGAIQLAMEKMPITMHRSQSFVIGYGRVAQTLCGMLKGLGAEVTVCARSLSQLAKCRILGYQTNVLKELPGKINQADVVFNTVPFLIIDEKVLIQIKKETLIIDLAASPGGTDFEKAKGLGISAILASGLPGKVAPLTAGQILANAYPKIIESHIS